MLEQPEADAVVRSGAVPEMRDAIANGHAGKTVWFFDRVPNETRCFEHTVVHILQLVSQMRNVA